jgi:glutamate racemase
MPDSSAPIGVFDSGVGGLSVLQALRRALPQAQFVYVADSAHAPYGEKTAAFVQERSHAIARFLHERHGIAALVVACNTATAAAAESLRQAWADMPLVGVEPAIKPAARLSRTGHIGVMATRGTVGSARFARLLHDFGQGAHWHVRACDGLASAIENSTAASLLEDEKIRALCAHHTSALGQFGTEAGQIDTLVLGCTHYVFVRDTLQALLGPKVQLVDTGAAVARQTQRLLGWAPAASAAGGDALAPVAQIQLLTTGSLNALQMAAQRWLGLPLQCCAQVQVP